LKRKTWDFHYLAIKRVKALETERERRGYNEVVYPQIGAILLTGQSFFWLFSHYISPLTNKQTHVTICAMLYMVV